MLGALFVVSSLVVPADAQTRKSDPPRTKAEPMSWEAMVKRAPANRPLTAARECPSSPGGSCKITVTMGATCVPSQKPKDEFLRIHKDGDITIFWKLDEATIRNWRFDAEDGVKFEDSSQFDGKGNPSPVVFQWHAKAGAVRGLYRYTIKLIPKNGGAPCVIDPAIWI
ncbi:MAG TPA: hypothetical protein VM122_11080 [Usitatibacter sp.]|nr:hypothetical protein [Usitatibacter sp.]